MQRRKSQIDLTNGLEEGRMRVDEANHVRTMRRTVYAKSLVAKVLLRSLQLESVVQAKNREG